MKDILAWEKPDIVVNTGDVVSGYAWDKVHSPFTSKHYAKLQEVFEGTGIKYLSTAGNHEEDADMTREEVYELDRSLNSSMTQDNEVDATP